MIPLVMHHKVFYMENSQGKEFGGWIAINKSTGEWTVCETPKLNEPYKTDALNKAKII